MAKWKPEGSCHGLEYLHIVYKSKIKSIYLGIKCTDSVNFSIKRQSWLDNVFKSIGVSNEFETKDPEFDDSFYLITDNAALQRLIASSEMLRLAIKNIMRRERTTDLKPKQIYCKNGRFWVVFSVGGGYETADIEHVSLSLQKYFNDVVSSLNKETLSKSAWIDPFVIRAALFLAVSSGLAINGVVQWVRSYFGYFPLVLDNSPVFYDALKYSAFFLLIFLVVALFSLRRSARTHIVLLELSTVGALGIFLSTAMEMRDINMEWDRSPPQIHNVAIVNKYEQRSSGRRKRTHYYVVVKDWRCQCGNYKFEMSRAMYNSIGGDSISVIQKSGYLGYPWISQVLLNPHNF
ncbi:MAG: hypothetical protein B0W54_21560 [Cellvibrio sp. 79]|nr:MAG: hypothetical protein B0W54_21560 [Cellvibrio sp. 79]